MATLGSATFGYVGLCHRLRDWPKPVTQGLCSRTFGYGGAECSECQCPFICKVPSLIAYSEHRIHEAQQGQILDPPVICTKDRPRFARITGALEGRQCGGGARPHTCPRKPTCGQTPCRSDSTSGSDEEDAGPSPAKKSHRGRVYKCSMCHQPGHNCNRCHNN